MLNAMDDIIWSVNPQNDSLSSLIIRLREYAIPACEAKNITFEMNVNESIYSLKLGMEKRRNIYLIVKESINNAIKHSGCSQLSVTFTISHKLLDITIIDNGCGFDPTVRGKRNGVANMESRAKQANMEFSIKSEKNSGTYIFLKTKNHVFK
jgi:signal transduction histidine kinase